MRQRAAPIPKQCILVFVVFLPHLFLACASHYQAVPPGELVKLNDQRGASAQGLAVPAIDVTTRQRLTTVDGKLIEVDGSSPVRITTHSGDAFLFYQPIEAKLEGEYLSVRSRERKPARFPLRDVSSVEVVPYR